MFFQELIEHDPPALVANLVNPANVARFQLGPDFGVGKGTGLASFPQKQIGRIRRRVHGISSQGMESFSLGCAASLNDLGSSGTKRSGENGARIGLDDAVRAPGFATRT